MEVESPGSTTHECTICKGQRPLSLALYAHADNHRGPHHQTPPSLDGELGLGGLGSAVQTEEQANCPVYCFD